MTNIETILNLIKENLDFPIVPLVDSEVVADDCCRWWIGDWGRAEIKEIYVGRERIHIKDEDDEEEVLCDMVGCGYSMTPDGRDVYDLTDEEWDALYKSIPWIKCIVVRITTR